MIDPLEVHMLSAGGSWLGDKLNFDSGSFFAAPRIHCKHRGDGSLLLRSQEALGPHPVSILHSFRQWADLDAEHPLVAERAPDGGWRSVTYGQVERDALTVGEALLQLGLGPDRPLMVLSGNSVDSLVVTLGAMLAGVPVVPTSVAYSLQSQDHARLKQIAGVVNPGAAYAEDNDRFGPALRALSDVPAIVSGRDGTVGEELTTLWEHTPSGAIEAAFRGISGESVAKVMFTSGSTGAPKGVITTHGMLSSNQQMMMQAWPFLAEERPIIVDWLPWSHTFGGSHNVGMMLATGGTIYIDAGRPVPGLFQQTLSNLADIPPTIYFNVPAGYAQLVPVLEADPEFAAVFFSRLRLMFNAAAALPEALRTRLQDVAEKATGRRIPVTGSWGLTETAPAVTNAHFDFADARSIGVPLPGTEVLLIPAEDAYEIRVRGPMVTPGYLGRPDLTAEAFDNEGFYRTGDAVQFADPDDPNRGLIFRGRLAEDFKLSTGTFVRVGSVRTALLSSIPVLADAVIAGENQDFVAALAWVNVAEVRKLLGREPHIDGEFVAEPELAKHLASALGVHNAHAGSAGRIERLLLMAVPADLDLGEITDKGYVNQRKVLQSRSHLVAMLFADDVADGVITPERRDR